MAKKKIKVDAPDAPQKGQIDEFKISDLNDLVTKVRTDFYYDAASKSEWLNQRNTDVKAYFGVKKPTEWPFKGAAKISSGFHRISVDTVVANMQKSLFAPEKPIAVIPTNSNSLESAKYVEDLSNWQQQFEYKLWATLDKALPNAFVESFCVLKPSYNYLSTETQYQVTRYIAKEIPEKGLTYDHDSNTVLDAEGKSVLSLDPAEVESDDMDISHLKEVSFDVEKDECIFDGVKVNVIGASRFYMPMATPGDTPYEKVQRADHVIQQAYYTLSELKQLEAKGMFKNIGKVSKAVYSRLNDLLTQTKFQQIGTTVEEAANRELVEVLEWHGKWEIDGKYREVIVWIDPNSSTCLRVQPNLFGVRPFFPLVPFPVDDTPYGESLPKIIRGLVATLDLLMSTVTNIALLRSAPPKFFDPASGFDPSRIGNIGPNSWIPAREPGRNVLIPPQPEDPTASMQMIQLIINIIERVTSVNEVVQGQVSDRANTTATEVSQALVRSGVRFDLLYNRLKEQLSPMFGFIHKLTLRYMPLTKEISYMGKDKGVVDGGSRLMAINKGQLGGDYNFALVGNSIVTEQADLQKAITLYNTVGQHPYLTYKPESVYYMLYNIVKKLNPVAMDHILATPDEVKEIMRSRAAVQNEQEQQAAQAQGGQDPQAQAAAQQAQMQQMMAQQDMQMKQQKHEMDMKQQMDKHQLDMRMAEEKHQAELEAQRAKAKASKQAE